MTQDTPQKLEIDWLKTTGGAFAAVSSAFLLSTLGAAGTIIGAALGSVIVTVGGALYSQALARSHQRLAQVQTAAMRKVGVAQAEVRRAARRQGEDEAADAHLAHADEQLAEAQDELDASADEPATPGWRDRLGQLPWKQISLSAAGVFAAAVLIITVIELTAGESVASITGGSEGSGTTVGNLGGGSDTDTSDEDREGPSEGSTPSEAPADEPSEEPAPTDAPSVEPSPTAETPAPATTPTAPTASETAVPAEPEATTPEG